VDGIRLEQVDASASVCPGGIVRIRTVLTAGFEKLPAGIRAVHLISLGLVAISIILLVAPAPFHRIAAAGEAEERVLRYTTRMMLPAVGLLSAGLVGDAYVALWKITEMPWLSATLGLAALVGSAVLLYGIPAACRRRSRTLTTNQPS
jgi:hypothetical protein